MTVGATLRLLADDLTGALDTAAQFTARHGAIPAYPGTGPLPERGSFVIDGDTRAGTADAACRKVREMAPLLAGGSLAMLKIDSLLRGHTVEEIGAAFTHGGFRSCVIAPAFPAQGRITEGGRQWLVAGGLREDVSGSLVTRLEAAGLPTRGMGRALPISGSGVFVCDAISDADLDAIAAAAAALEPPVLWCGSAGLARALGGGAKWTCCCRGGESALLIVGSGHANALAQLEEVQVRWPGCTTTIRHPDDPWQPVASAPLSILQLAFEGTDAPGFLHRMRDFLANRLPGAPRPDTLIATGGDTLRAAIDALGASHLAVTGDFTPGIPVSRLCGGIWDGTTVISKSGAFGGKAALLGMVARALPEKPALARSRHAEGVAP